MRKKIEKYAVFILNISHLYAKKEIQIAFWIIAFVCFCPNLIGIFPYSDIIGVLLWVNSKDSKTQKLKKLNKNNRGMNSNVISLHFILFFLSFFVHNIITKMLIILYLYTTLCIDFELLYLCTLCMDSNLNFIISFGFFLLSTSSPFYRMRALFYVPFIARTNRLYIIEGFVQTHGVGDKINQ